MEIHWIRPDGPDDRASVNAHKTNTQVISELIAMTNSLNSSLLKARIFAAKSGLLDEFDAFLKAPLPPGWTD